MARELFTPKIDTQCHLSRNSLTRDYYDTLLRVLNEGIEKQNRTGVATLSLFAQQMRFTLHKGFPILTEKKIPWRLVKEELAWMLRGDTNVKSLQENNVTIWDEWADENGDLGPIYGKQWRNFGGVDQIVELENNLKNNPFDRRHVLTAWNPGELKQMKLPPCHLMTIWNVEPGDGAKNILNCHMTMRSADMFLGVPFNIAFYAALTEMLARVAGMKAGTLSIAMVDCHIYTNHIEQVKTFLNRLPTYKHGVLYDPDHGGVFSYDYPRIQIQGRYNSVLDIETQNMFLNDYNPHPTISAPVAV